MKRALRIAVLALSAASAFPSGAFASSTPPRRLAFAPDSSWTAEGDRTGARFGSAVATAGDVNGDGFSDLLIGAPGVFAGRGQAFLYLSGPSGLESTAAWFTQGALAATDLGRSVAPVGDVNSDGFADFVVGASHWADVSDNAGGVFLYLGSASGAGAQPAWVAEGEQGESGFGTSAADAGDVNGDGFRDLLVGAPNYDGVATDAGRAVLFLGNGASYASTPAWSIESDEQGGALGTIVTGAFDLNADGFDDVAMSAPGVTNGGSVLVFLGSASGLPAAPSTEITRLDPGFARSLAALGDVNGDGYADLAVGAPDFASGEANEGTVWIFFGGATGVDATPDWQVEGDEVDAHFGASLATSGDLNGDGFADLCVGSGARGRAWLFLGGANGPATQAAWIREEDGAGSGFGAAVSGAGDLDSDGFTDLVVGAPDLDNGQTNEGRVHVYLGHGEGPAATAVVSVSGPAADALGAALAGDGDVNGDGLSDLVVGAPGASTPELGAGRVQLYLNGASSPSWSYDAHTAGAHLGAAVANAGDVNGDGFADLLVSAPSQKVGGANDAGAAFLFLGKPNGPSNTPGWSVSGGAAGQELGRSLCGAGDVNGDGFSDLAVSSGPATARVYLGSASGPRADADWTLSIPENGDWRDLLAVGAGDVNRDGLSDLLLVGRRYQGGLAEAGGAFLFLGSNAGLESTPWWSAVRAEASFGASAAAAGDLDGDGFADFVIGSPEEDSGAGAVSFFFGGDLTVQEPWSDLLGQAGEGLGATLARIGDSDGDGHTDLAIGAPGNDAVVLLSSGASGPVLGTSWGAAPGAGFGAGLTSAGDMNGDGFADLAIGSPLAGGFSIYLGNARDLGDPGRVLLPRQAKRSGARLSPLARSDSETSIRLLARGRSAAGRRPLRLEWNIDYLSVLLPRVPIARSAWSRSGAPTAGQGSTRDWNQVVSGLAIGSNYHWKLRIASDSAFFPSTPWATLSPAAPNELHCRTRGQFSTIGVDDVRGTGPRWLSVAPNPARDRLTVRFSRPSAGRFARHAVDGTTLALFDAGGRLRRAWTLDRDRLAAGELQWDGRDGEGRSLPAGVYFFELRAGQARTTARVVWESR